MAKKRYVVDGNWTVCTDGQIQQGIKVVSQSSIYANKKRVATEMDRMYFNFNCAKLINAAAIVGTIAGAIAGAATGASLGIAIGGRFGIVGAVVGGVIGGLVGGVAGAIGGSIGASVATRKLMNTFLPCFCAILTKPFPWSSIHEKVFPEMPRALMPDATLNCLLGGLVSIILPDLTKALDYAKISKYLYLDPDEDNDDNDAKKANGKGLEKAVDFEEYDPDALGYTDVDTSFFSDIELPEGVGYEQEGNHHYLIDENSGLKAGVYETPDGNYLLAYRGTHQSEDWVDDNLKQGVGLGGNDGQQYDQAGDISKALNDKAKKENKTLDVTGHSLGGGLGILGGALSNGETYVFNAADVHDNTFRAKGITRKDAVNVYKFSSSKDPLTFANNNISLMPSGSGKPIVLSTKFGKFYPGLSLEDNIMNSIMADGHDLPCLIEAIEEVIGKENNAKVYALK
jgi:hypothetical protein